MNLKEVKEKFDKGEKLEFVFFWRTNSYFSNWHPADFTVDGVEYWCVEQYMMAKKAELPKPFYSNITEYKQFKHIN